MQPPKFRLFIDLKAQVSKAGQSLWLYYIIQVCVSFGMSLFAGFILSFLPFPLYYGLSEIARSLVLIIGSALSGLLAFWFFNARYDVQIKKRFSSSFRWKQIWDGYSVLALVSFVSSLLFTLWNMFSPNPIVQPDFGYSSNIVSNLLLFLVIVLLGPFVEELFFRGALLTSFKKYGEIFAILFSSLCFALMHMNIAQGIPTFFMGCVLGYMYVKSGSLWLPIGIHVLNNGISFLAMSGIGSMIAPWIVILALMYGVVCLIKNRDQIESGLKGWIGPSESWKIVFKNGWILSFIILFVISSLIMLF